MQDSTPLRATLKLKPSPREFLIWRKGGARPEVRHRDLQAAIAELTRLRKLYPEYQYTIYELAPLRMGPRR
jgi:hypothetical protein